MSLSWRLLFAFDSEFVLMLTCGCYVGKVYLAIFADVDLIACKCSFHVCAARGADPYLGEHRPALRM